MSIVRLIWAFAAVAAISSLGIACGDSADDTSMAAGSDSSKTFDWGVISTKPPRTLVVGGGIGYCEGDPRPKIMRSQIEYRDDNVYIRLNVKRPPKEASNGEVCLGSELLITRGVTLRRDLSDAKVYNANTEPPDEVWPASD